jgi:hypothetical protein
MEDFIECWIDFFIDWVEVLLGLRLGLRLLWMMGEGVHEEG